MITKQKKFHVKPKIIHMVISSDTNSKISIIKLLKYQLIIHQFIGAS